MRTGRLNHRRKPGPILGFADAPLSDAEWTLVQPHLARRSKRGRPSLDDRRALEGMLHIAWSGKRWDHLPAHYGKANSVWRKFDRWVDEGIIFRLLEAFLERGSSAAGADPLPILLHRRLSKLRALYERGQSTAKGQRVDANLSKNGKAKPDERQSLFPGQWGTELVLRTTLFSGSLEETNIPQRSQYVSIERKPSTDA